jgi:hypothetical protein
MQDNKSTMANKCTSFAVLEATGHRHRATIFGTHNQGCGGENGTSNASSKKAQYGPSTHVINAASFVKL